MTIQPQPQRALGPARSRGQAMLLTVLLLGVGASAIVYALATPGKEEVASDKITAAALQQARDALIGHAVSHQTQPGILPCPDNDNDGTADAPCGALGVTAIGRLPWRTLGIPPLRDGAGECLWYAVSGNFKNSGLSGPAVLNSDSPGTLAVSDSTGAAVLSGANSALALVFAAGPALPGQDRTPGAASICGGNTNAANYLDAYTVAALNFDNATGSETSSFVMAPAVIQAGQINDRLVPITSEALFSVVNIRVAKEALAAMEAYRTANDVYPFANPYGISAGPYDCVTDEIRGRFPITLAGCGMPAWGAALPPWFAPNNWNLVTHYAISRSCAENSVFPLVEALGILPPGLARRLLGGALCGLADELTRGNLNAINQQLKKALLPLLPLGTDDYLFVTGVTGADGARALVIVTGRALGPQNHNPPNGCASPNQCMEDAFNIDTTDATYVKPSRFPASNDRMAVACDPAVPCPKVP